MFSRAHRLRSRRVFANVRQRGIRRVGNFLLLRGLKIGNGPVKLAVIMSAKTAKRATVRNRHKRVVRDEIRQLLDSLPSGWNFTVTIKQTVNTDSGWEDLREDVRKLFAGPF